jgi:hypothetical protein
MSPQERDDKLLQEYLAGDSALSRLYRDRATEQPDARLDATIRARAHAAVARDARVAHSPFAHNWIVPTSLAAVLVLSVSVVVLIPEPVEVPEREEAGAPDSVPDAVIRNALPAKAADVEQQPAASSTAAPARAAKRHKMAADEGGPAGGGRAAGYASDTPQSPHKDEKVPGEERKEQAARGQSHSADEAQSLSAAPAALESASQAAAEPRPIPTAAVRDDPRAWLRFIETLLDEQNPEGAKSNLRAFRSQYPDFPLPASLVPLAAALGTERP